MAIKIDKGRKMVPFRVPRNTSYPFQDMKVGDSFLCPHKEEVRIRTAASYAGKRSGKHFRVLRQENGSFRVWRTR